ncbi:hypothetical protein [Phytohabitans kaempferiae]|uniref:ABC transporter permease n=1 Tax=Phytohabitans kaempferiae TaxID=1620943 RepID=A0ABV6LV64_9ACTN
MGKWSKAGALLLGTLALATAFVWAYAGALHEPTPREAPVGVVRGDSAAAELITALGPQLKAIEYADRHALIRREVYAVLAASVLGLTASTTPSLFRGMHRWNLPGLGSDLIKSVVYFDRKAAGWPITSLAIWAVAGMGVLLAAAAMRGRTLRHDSPR